MSIDYWQTSAATKALKTKPLHCTSCLGRMLFIIVYLYYVNIINGNIHLITWQKTVRIRRCSGHASWRVYAYVIILCSHVHFISLLLYTISIPIGLLPSDIHLSLLRIRSFGIVPYIRHLVPLYRMGSQFTVTAFDHSLIPVKQATDGQKTQAIQR